MSNFLKNSSIGKVASNLEQSQDAVVEVISNYGDDVYDRNLAQRELFLEKFYPEANQRALAMAQLRLIENEFEFRRRALEMTRETQIQALGETCNQYLVKAKASGRAETAKYLMNQAQKLEEDLELISNKFIDSYERKMQNLEKITHPLLKQKYQQDLDREINDFFARKEALLAQFNHIVDEGI
jgi:oligoribonuclease NrnB/cAMP/cGMP phosphodiesterase (DHH superfamily)